LLALSKVPLISVIDADESIRSAVSEFPKSSSFAVEVFAAAEAFLGSKRMGDTACVIIDAHMPGMGGLQLQSRLPSHENPEVGRH
jgi:FixJ family two-component response regulator